MKTLPTPKKPSVAALRREALEAKRAWLTMFGEPDLSVVEAWQRFCIARGRLRAALGKKRGQR